MMATKLMGIEWKVEQSVEKRSNFKNHDCTIFQNTFHLST